MRTATTALRTLRPRALTLASPGLLLAGCGTGSEEPTGEPADPTAHNDADVAFATQMVPHHAEALAMADLAIGRKVGADFADLRDDIRAAQVPEIELMVDWLEEWGEPVPTAPSWCSTSTWPRTSRPRRAPRSSACGRCSTTDDPWSEVLRSTAAPRSRGRTAPGWR